MRVAILALTACATIVSPSVALAGGHGDDSCAFHVDPDTRPMASRAGTVTVYLDGDGGVVRGSSIVASRGLRSLQVPRYSRGAASWGRLVGCVRSVYRDFNVDIVDERPDSGRYITIMVGGNPSMLGYPQGVGGVAPYSGRVVDGATGFVFERGVGGERSRCEATAHEVGHTLGLDHSALCSDIMSYGSCGPKAFRDRDASCGEYRARSCSNGAQTQNSHALLTRLVGRRNASKLPPSTSRRPSTNRPERRKPRPTPTPPQKADRYGPDLSMITVPSQPRNSIYYVHFRARDRSGLADIKLRWQRGDRLFSLSCGDLPRGAPVACGRSGNEYVFALRVGKGRRKFAVQVTDRAGNVTRSKSYHLNFR